MSQLSGTASSLQHNPKWKLGELGDVARRQEVEGSQAESIEELLEFLKNSERDERYADRVLEAVEAALLQVRSHGLNQQTVVAVESLRPNTIPTAIQRCMTSNFSNVHKYETVSALESYADYGRWGILLLLIAVVIKVLDWVINKGSPAGGARDFGAEVDNYISAMNNNLANLSGSRAKVAANQADVEVIKDLKSVTVKASALPHVNVAKGMRELSTAATLLDNLVAECKLDPVIDALSAAKGKKPIFSGLFKRVAAGEVKATQIPQEAVRLLLGVGLANTMYAPSVTTQIMGAWPTAMSQAGIRLPSSECQKRFSITLKNLGNQTDDLTQGAKLLANLQARTDTPAMNDRDVTMFLETIVEAIEITDTCVNSAVNAVGNSAPQGKQYVGSVGFLSTPKLAEGLVGYETDENTEGHMVYSWITGHCFLSTLALDALLEKSLLSDKDMKDILTAMQFMLPENVDKNRIDLGPHKALLQKFEKLKKQVEEIAKKEGQNKTRTPAITEVNSQLQRRLKGAGTEGRGQYNRFMANTDSEGNVDVFGAFKSILRITRDMLKTGAVLQQSVDRHNKSPYVKADK